MRARCDCCGMTYEQERTGLRYRDVYAMLWSGSDNPADWRHKGRHTVLGLWHEIKQNIWAEHLEYCGSSQVDNLS
jgi:hypothetical protein